MRFDYENVMEYAKEQARDEGLAEGRAKGLAEGEAKAKRETAKKLLSLGDSIEKISIATGLSQEEIQAL